MPLDPITAIANAISSIGGMALPYIQDHFNQLYEQLHQTRIKEWQEILDESDSAERADLVHEYIIRLLNQSGQSVPRGLSRNVSIPLDVLGLLISEVSEGIKKDQIISKIQFK